MIDNYFEKEYEPFHRVYEHSISRNGIYLGDIASSQDQEFIK